MPVRSEYSLCENYRAEARALADSFPGAKPLRFEFFSEQCQNCTKARRPSDGGCLEYIAPAWLIANLVKEGAYLVSPGWLLDWQRHTAAWGADDAARAGFAAEFMRSVCLLDTLCVPGVEQSLADMATALGLPALRIPVGLDHFASHFYTPVPESFRSESARPAADYALALDLLATLAGSLSETELTQELFRIFAMLFAPATQYFFQFSGGEPAAIQYAGEPARPCSEDELRQCRAFTRVHAPADADSRLVVPLDFLGERLALLVMADFAAPEHHDAYRNLLESIMPICGVALSNARKAQEIQRKTDVIQTKQTELLSVIKLKDRIFSIIGHDLKGPVGGISGVLHYLSEESAAAALTPDNRMLLAETRKAAAGVLQLLENLLEWGRSSEGMLDLHPAVLDFETFIAGIFALLRIQAEAKGLSLQVRSQPGFSLYADAKTMSIALRNLISNAIKFTPRGGSVTVWTEVAEDLKTIAVTDTGLGMPAETIAKIVDSDRVVSTRGTEGESGTGLGLLLSQDYIERNGGKLRIESAPGSGTTMRMDFPV